MRMILFAVLLLLTACSGVKPRSEPPEVVEVKVALPVACVDSVPAPAKVHTDAELVDLNEAAFVDAVHADRLALKSAEEKLRATLEACKTK